MLNVSIVWLCSCTVFRKECTHVKWFSGDRIYNVMRLEWEWPGDRAMQQTVVPLSTYWDCVLSKNTLNIHFNCLLVLRKSCDVVSVSLCLANSKNKLVFIAFIAGQTRCVDTRFLSKRSVLIFITTFCSSLTFPSYCEALYFRCS